MLGGDGDENTAAGRAVELGHDEAVDARHIAEDVDLIHGVLTRRRVERLEHRMGCVGLALLEDADDLFELGHQFGLVLKTARRVDDENVRAVPDRRVIGVEGEPRRIGADRPGDDLRARALAPDLQLFDRRRAERVAGRHRDRKPGAGEFRGKFADGRRLAGTVDADDQDDMRGLFQIEFELQRDRIERLLYLLGQHALHLGAGDFLAIATLGEAIGDAHRRLDAQIGLDEDVLEILKHLLVEAALGEDRGDLPGELGRGSPERGAQALEPGKLGCSRAGGLRPGLFAQAKTGIAGNLRAARRGSDRWRRPVFFVFILVFGRQVFIEPGEVGFLLLGVVAQGGLALIGDRRRGVRLRLRAGLADGLDRLRRLAGYGLKLYRIGPHVGGLGARRPRPVFGLGQRRLVAESRFAVLRGAGRLYVRLLGLVIRCARRIEEGEVALRLLFALGLRRKLGVEKAEIGRWVRVIRLLPQRDERRIGRSVLDDVDARPRARNGRVFGGFGLAA